MLNAAVRRCALSPMVGFSISQGSMSDSPYSNPESKEDFFHLNESAYTVLPHSDGLLSWTTVWLFTLVVFNGFSLLLSFVIPFKLDSTG